MKAFKISSIEWTLNHITDENEKKEILSNLPSVTGFITSDDNFDYCQKVPILLKKKFGYGVESFVSNSYRIATNVIDLLKMVAPTGEKSKAIFSSTGKLSPFGQMCLDGVIANLYYAKRLRRNNTPENKIPIIVDECMLSVEKIFNQKFEDVPVEFFEEKLNNLIKKLVLEKNKKYKEMKRTINNTKTEEAEA